MALTNNTAFERARLAYEQTARRQREALLRRRAVDRSRTLTTLALCACLVASVLGVAIYNDWLQMPSRPVSSILKDDSFATTRTGQVRSPVAGNVCREMQFSNDSGKYIDGTLVPCEPEAGSGAPAPRSSDRMNSIRDAFNKR